MSTASWVLSAFSLLSLCIGLWQWLVARRFPLHQRLPPTAAALPVTLLKPLKGADDATEACLRSWLEQAHDAPVQVLFGIASKSDPAWTLASRLLEQYPQADARVHLCDHELGINSKVSKLIQLARLAKHGILVISDADVRAPKDLVSQITQPLHDPANGLTHCFYRIANASTLAMRTEAVAVNADFWSQVLQSTQLKPMDFALGAVMAVRRSDLESIGGFESLADQLADDYYLGNKLAARGLRIAQSRVVVDCFEPISGWGAVWRHQLRWARTIRFCQPVPYFFSILSNVTLWSILSLAAANSLTARLMALTALVFRIGSALDLQERLTQARRHLFYDWLVPVKDLMGAAIWACAFFGSTVTWRGVRYRVLRGGKLHPWKAPAERPSRP